MILAPIKFRKLTTDDLKQILVVERNAFTMPWSAAMMRDSLAAAHTECYGTFDEDEKLLGYVVISLVPDELEILSMAVSSTHQGQGIGRSLLRKVSERGKKHKAKQVYLEVRRTNSHAIGLYQKSGFKVIGERKAYYPSETDAKQREDAVVMELSLT